MQQHAIEAARLLARTRRLALRTGKHFVGPRKTFFESGGRRGGGAGTPLRGLRQQRTQIVEPEPAVADHADHRQPELGAQAEKIQIAAARLQFIHHREHQRHRQPHRAHFGEHRQRTTQGGGIRDEEHSVGARLFRHLAAQHADRDALILTDGIQGVEPGQIREHHRWRAVRQMQRAPHATIHRHSGIVAGARAHAGQRVEERGLAAVRRTHQREMHESGRLRIRRDVARGLRGRRAVRQGSASTTMRSASFGRRQIIAPRVHAMIGPPKGARRS